MPIAIIDQSSIFAKAHELPGGALFECVQLPVYCREGQANQHGPERSGEERQAVPSGP